MRDRARRASRRARSFLAGMLWRAGQAARSARSATVPGRVPLAAGAWIRGRGRGARAERIVASDARISSSFTYRRARSARRGTVKACPGRGRRVAVMAVTSFAVRDGLEARPVRRDDGLPAAGEDARV